MKIRTTMSVLAALVALSATSLFTSGCATTGSISAEQGAAGLRIATSNSVALALTKHPEYAGVAAALAIAIEASIAEQTAITPQIIGEFVVILCRKHAVAQEDIPLWVNLAQSVYQAYVTTYKPAVVSGADPRVILYARAFSDGLRDAIAAVALSKQAATPGHPVPTDAVELPAAGVVTRAYFGACGTQAIGRVTAA